MEISYFDSRDLRIASCLECLGAVRGSGAQFQDGLISKCVGREKVRTKLEENMLD